MESEALLGKGRPDGLYAWRSVREEASVIWAMAWKISLASFCRMSVFTISTAFLGQLGTRELAASALAQSVIGALRIVTWASSTSLSTLCGQAYGARNFELVGTWLQTGVVVLSAASIPLMIAHLYAYLVLQYIVHDDPDLVSLAQTFASYSALSVWPNALYVSLRSYLRSQQIMAPIAVVDFATVGLYIVSNYVFIYGCLGWNGLGFVGSPLASFFCATMQPLALFVYAFVVQRHHEKTWTGWSWQCLDQVRLKQFVTLTSSLFVYLAMDEWIYNVVTVVAAQLGSVNLAANSILFNVWGLAYGVYLGFSTPIQVRASHAMGANDPSKAKQVTVVGFALGSIATVVVVVVLLVGRRPLVGVFTQDPALHDILDTVLPVFCIAASISGLHVMLSSVLEAMSLALTLVVMSGVGSWGILLPVSYYLGISEALGLAGLWWGSVVGEAAKFMFTGIALFGLYDWAAIAHRIARDTEAIAVAEEVEALTSADTVKSPVAAATNSSF